MTRINIHRLSQADFDRAVHSITLASRPRMMAHASLVDGEDTATIAQRFNVSQAAVSHARQRVFKAFRELQHNPIDAAKLTVEKNYGSSDEGYRFTCKLGGRYCVST